MTILEIIDKALLDEQEARKDRVRSGKWSPSSFGRCYRLQFWNRANETPSDPPDSRTLRVFRCGQLFHDFVQGYLPKHDTEVVCETEDCYGRADVVTQDSVIDIKSVHSGAFFHMNKEDIAKSKLTNWMQVAYYAMVLKKPNVGLTFISKDDLCVDEYILPTEHFKPYVDGEIGALNQFWKAKLLPPAQPRAYASKEKKTGKVVYKDCAFCGFRTKCKNLERKNENN
jgi:hypothetical protein